MKSVKVNILRKSLKVQNVIQYLAKSLRHNMETFFVR
jgi:hypothetical protein